jgi:MFS superfamily sulfate permease-like transporter
VIDATAVTELDYSAGQTLKELHQDLSRKGVVLAVIVVQVRHKGFLERLGLVDLIGANRIFESRHACMEAYRSEMLASPSELPTGGSTRSD